MSLFHAFALIFLPHLATPSLRPFLAILISISRDRFQDFSPSARARRFILARQMRGRPASPPAASRRHTAVASMLAEVAAGRRGFR